MTTYHPDKEEVIRSKLLGIETSAFKARHLEQEDEIRKHYRLISALVNELWIILQTEDDKGKKMGWWE